MLKHLNDLPKPTTFEQGQRKKFGAYMVAAGVFAGLVALGMVAVFFWMAFKLPLYTLTILYILAFALAAFLLGQTIVMVSMAVGGPVGRFKVSATREGASLEASDDDEPRRAPDYEAPENPL